ncbi:DMT family transporter [Hoeflea poritis]|uniref:EamA family transporter n=1 Tax=Hoeflea poritis TaxID=2993659 RepID=A0ABT4VHC0_9HYPH|nr:EamA family transporter [Hoeflea poritis]MDA4844098.1 EamA family transporter [Hoeflea poritis]
MGGKLSPIDYMMGVAVALVWGMGVVFAKAAIDQFPPILLMAFRFAVTALVLVWFVKPPVGQFLKIFSIALVSAAIQYSLTFTGLVGIDASIAALVVQLEVPFLVLVGAVAFREKTSLRKWFGIAIAFSGVGLIAGEPKLGAAWLSILLVVGGAFSWALGQAMVRTLRDMNGMAVTAWVAVFATPQLLVMSLIFEGGHWEAVQSADWIVWTAVLYLGVVMTVIGYSLWYSLVRRHPLNQVAPFLLMLPVFSIAGGALFLGERLTFQVMIGGAVVIAGVAFILTERSRPEPVTVER